MDRVSVWRGRYGDPELFGPLPGLRDGEAAAYEFALGAAFEPWPGKTCLERTFVLLDLGVSMAVPSWRRWRREDGEVVDGIDAELEAPATWYVDLVDVEQDGDAIVCRDLYLDVMVPVDGRHQRMLDLEELADAVADGSVPIEVALDGMRRWQAFLDRHLHEHRFPRATWTDFPPAVFARLAAAPTPIGPVVTYG